MGLRLSRGILEMWLGFFAWYRGLAEGGTVAGEPVAVAAAFPEHAVRHSAAGQTLDTATLAFAVAVVGTVVVGKAMPVRPASPRSQLQEPALPLRLTSRSPPTQ
ncbi:MAG: hypothetical protein NVS2B4_00280 [Ramlibacter sp.]